ncbi:hypothetical protein HED50_03160 [Ochrobactrum oryzae]|nr:hypothetical protein [Brucella oryzae]
MMQGIKDKYQEFIGNYSGYIEAENALNAVNSLLWGSDQSFGPTHSLQIDYSIFLYNVYLVNNPGAIPSSIMPGVGVAPGGTARFALYNLGTRFDAIMSPIETAVSSFNKATSMIQQSRFPLSSLLTSISSLISSSQVAPYDVACIESYHAKLVDLNKNILFLRNYETTMNNIKQIIKSDIDSAKPVYDNINRYFSATDYSDAYSEAISLGILKVMQQHIDVMKSCGAITGTSPFGAEN